MEFKVKDVKSSIIVTSVKDFQLSSCMAIIHQETTLVSKEFYIETIV